MTRVPYGVHCVDGRFDATLKTGAQIVRLACSRDFSAGHKKDRFGNGSSPGLANAYRHHPWHLVQGHQST
jgi:hypothetical protein